MAFITAVLVIGIKESARFNSAMVVIKLVVVVGFILVGAFYVQPANWHPFAPNGWRGIATGAALIFFSYIGFDAISTTAEEAHNPQRDMPIAMIVSLGICTLLYVLITAVLTGMVPYSQLGTAEPLATALNSVHLDWAAGLISFGAVVSMSAVLLVFQLGQPRIFFAMSRDGLLPKIFASVHPRFRTPHVTTILTGVFVAAFAGFMDINEAVELTNIGTLFAFILVGIGIIILRSKEPERPRPFPLSRSALDSFTRHPFVRLPDDAAPVVDLGPLWGLVIYWARNLLPLRGRKKWPLSGCGERPTSVVCSTAQVETRDWCCAPGSFSGAFLFGFDEAWSTVASNWARVGNPPFRRWSSSRGRLHRMSDDWSEPSFLLEG